MKKKQLTIGIVALFILILLPITNATVSSDIETKEEPVPAAIRIYGYAYVNGTITEPKSLFPVFGALTGYRLFFYAEFTKGIIKPVYSITQLRNITIPDKFDRAVIHGSLCTWDKFEPIGDTGEYSIGGTIIHLVVDLY